MKNFLSIYKKISRVLDLIGLSWHVSYVDIIMKNTNIAIGERYSKYFTELFFMNE
jgi:hypothetical protein